MTYRCWVLLCVLCLCLYGCGDEGLESLYDPAVQAAPPVAVTGVPSELQEQLWGNREAYIEKLTWALQHGEDFRPVAEDYLERICQLDHQRAFYQKYIDAGGVAILASISVADETLQMARNIVFQMTAKHPEIREYLTLEHKHYQIIINGYYENIRGIPEFTDHHIREFPIPHCGAAFGNAYCVSQIWHLPEQKRDRIQSPVMQTFVHEFAHAIHLFAISELDPGFNARLKQAYETAVASGTWKDLYAETNYREY
ncbi:MAG: hypothetical protein OXH00_21460 [Candidatus Poribacteria bacterium]|nr:hypothetical protein [Candidatus Poribacteria bacterium]